MTDASKLTHPLKKVRGIGAAKSGTEHWWMQRVTAVAILPLAVWFLCNLGMAALAGDVQGAMQAWLAHPLNALGALLLFIALPLHARLGIQVVIEDYLHAPSTHYILLLANKYIFLAATVIAAMSILKLHFGA